MIMNIIEKCCHDFYLHVAKLFYAIAFIDGEIREEEYLSLKETLRKEWLQKRQGKEELVASIIACFEQLRKDEKKAVDCFQEFVAYKNKHEQLFSNTMKSMIWEVSCEIADAVRKKNKSELIILARLGKQLGIMK